MKTVSFHNRTLRIKSCTNPNPRPDAAIADLDLPHLRIFCPRVPTLKEVYPPHNLTADIPRIITEWNYMQVLARFTCEASC